MDKILLLVCCSLMTLSLFGQEKNTGNSKNHDLEKSRTVASQLAFFKENIGIRKALRPFIDVEYKMPNHNRSAALIENTNFVKIDQTEIKKLLQYKPKTIGMPIMLGWGLEFELELFEKSVFSSDAVIRTSEGQLFTPGYNVHYRGVVKGLEGSIVGISFFEDEVFGVISTIEHGTWEIGLVEGQREVHVIYKSEDLEANLDFECSAADLTELSEHNSEISEEQLATAGPKCINVYLEADYAMFQNKGGTQQVTNYITGLFNNVLTIFENEGLYAEVSELFIWTTPDNYSKSNALNALNEFRALRQNFNGNIAHLLALGGSGNAGFAYVDVICNKNNAFAYSKINQTYENYPTYSWSVKVVAHEMGHNTGSRHTHWCDWPGGAIDNCWPTEGGCAPGPAPSNGGTIMSYCQNTQYGVNLANGFGTLPGDRIRGRYNNAPCLKACSFVCETLTADFVVTHSTCGMNNGSIEVLPSGGDGPYVINIGQGFTHNTYYSNLAPGTYLVRLVDANDCLKEYNIIIEPSFPILVNLDVQSTSCGLENGSISADVISGTPPYRFDIGNGFVDGSNFEQLAAGAYMLIVTDVDDCFLNRQFTITPSTPLVIEKDVFHTRCGLDNGKILIDVIEGSSPYSFTINGEMSPSSYFNHLNSEEYVILIEDEKGCTVNESIEIAPSVAVEADAELIMTSCTNDDGMVRIHVKHGVAPFRYMLGDVEQYDPDFEGLTQGNYTWKVTDRKGCTYLGEVSIQESEQLSFDLDAKHSGCKEDIGTLRVIPLNGQEPFEFNIGMGWQPVPIFTNLGSGNYEVQVRDAFGCTGFGELALDSIGEVDFSVTSNPSQCNTPTGSIMIQTMSGFAPFVFSVNGLESDQPSFGSLLGGEYLVSVRDSLGCSTSQVITLSNNSDLRVSIFSESASCNLSDGSVLVSADGGFSPYTYRIGNQSQGNGSFGGLKSGIYTVQTEDALGCKVSIFAEVQGFREIELDLTVLNTSCGRDEGAVQIIANGGDSRYAYFLNQSELKGNIAYGLSAGEYLIHVSDQSGCWSDKTFNVLASTTYQVETILKHTLCNQANGSITFNIDGGVLPFSFDIGNGRYRDLVFEELRAGVFPAEVIDADDCAWSADITIMNDGEKPEAAFDFVRSGNEVQLINLSRGLPEQWSWNLGNGQQSNLYSPRYRYPANGQFSICLNIQNNCGLDEICQTIHIDGSIDCGSNDSIALVTLYESCLGDQWMQKWDLNSPISTWYGIEIDEGGCVLSIALPENQLKGQIPASLGSLKALKKIDLSGNDLSGLLPDELTQLNVLEQVLLGGNNLVGSFPDFDQGWVLIQELDLSFNELEGSFPPSILNNRWLQKLKLNNNHFSGPLGQNINKLSNLSTLDLSNNLFDGNIPEELGSLQKLEELYLNHNSFEGKLPETILDLKDLRSLWLSNNQFRGLPRMSDLTKLEDNSEKGLRLENNNLIFSDLMPSLSLFENMDYAIYTPQAKVFRNTTLYIRFGEPLYLNIETDEGLDGVVYTWFKDGHFWKTTNTPEFVIDALDDLDKGIYHCEITHPFLPDLTLLSHDITLDFNTSIASMNRRNEVKIIPNPVRTGDEISLLIKGNKQDVSLIEILNLNGKKLSVSTFINQTDESNYRMTAPGMSGLYIINIIFDDGRGMAYKIVVID